MANDFRAPTEPWRAFTTYARDPLAKAVYTRGWGRLRFSLLYLSFYLLNGVLGPGVYALLWPAEFAEQLRWALRPTNVAFSLIIPPLTAGFYHWISDAPRRLIVDLIGSDVFKNLPEHDLLKLNQRVSLAQRLFDYHGWTFASLAIGALLMPTVAIFTMLGLAVSPPGQHNWVGALIFFPAGFVGAYMVCMIIAQEIRTISAVRGLFLDMPMTLYPWHPDHCGGLRPLNDYALKFTYILAIFGFGLSLGAYQSWLAGGLQRDLVLLIAIGVYAVLAPYCFFASLGTAHVAMEKVKEAQLETISERFNVIYRESQSLLSKSGGNSLRNKVDEIEQLHRLYKLTEQFPVWPFDSANIRRFVAAVSGSLLPFTPVIANIVIKAIQSAFK